jgi:hypothetical protein
MRLLKAATLVLISATLVLCLPAQETVEVTASGQGVSERDAIYDALLAALSQHSGMSIETEKELRRLSLSREDNVSSSESIVVSLAERIRTATKGEVLGYSIIAKAPAEGGLLRVTLSAKLGVYRRSEQSERLRIAVPGFRPGGARPGFDRLVTSRVVSLLSQTRKFAILERDWEGEAASEALLLRSGETSAAERVRLGQRLGADYLLIGTVTGLTLLGAPDTGDSLLTPIASCVVDFRLVEFATGQVKVARVTPIRLTSIQAKVVSGGRAPADASDALSERVASYVSESITDAAYPITIVSASGEGSEVALNQGGERLKVGARYTVLFLGEPLVDPQTRETLGRAEIVAGIVEVSRVTPKVSYATIVEQKRPLQAGMIVRAAAPGATSGAGKLQIRKDDNSW